MVSDLGSSVTGGCDAVTDCGVSNLDSIVVGVRVAITGTCGVLLVACVFICGGAIGSIRGGGNVIRQDCIGEYVTWFAGLSTIVGVSIGVIKVAEFSGVEGKEMDWIEVDDENGAVSEVEDVDVDVDEMVGRGGLFMKVLDNGGGNCCDATAVVADGFVARVPVKPRKSIGLRRRVCVST